jgi:hypothetical protein
MSFEVEQTFRNIVNYYSMELGQIRNGKNASTLFTYRQRKKLTKLGVLQLIRDINGSRLKLTDRAKETLIQTPI